MKMNLPLGAAVTAANPPDMAAGEWELKAPVSNRFAHVHVVDRELEIQHAIMSDLLWLVYNGHRPIVETAGDGLTLELWDPAAWYTGRVIIVEKFATKGGVDVRVRSFFHALHEARTYYADGDPFKVAMEKLEAERVRLRDEIERKYREEGA